MAVLLNGDAITEPGSRGEAITDQSFLLLFNAGDQPVTFTLPGGDFGSGWQVVTDTAEQAHQAPPADPPSPLTTRDVASRSVVILRAAGS